MTHRRMSTKFIRFESDAPQDPDFETLQREWYTKLAQEGFDDIETVEPRFTGRPLKKWSTSFYESNKVIPGFCDTQEEYAPIASSFPDGRYSKEEEFLEREDFISICETICSHGNRHLRAVDIRVLWVRYCDGQTQRQIARGMNTSKQTVARILRRIQEWMALL